MPLLLLLRLLMLQEKAGQTKKLRCESRLLRAIQ